MPGPEDIPTGHAEHVETEPEEKEKDCNSKMKQNCQYKKKKRKMTINLIKSSNFTYPTRQERIVKPPEQAASHGLKGFVKRGGDDSDSTGTCTTYCCLF
jgi:hypothetical protein